MKNIILCGCVGGVFGLLIEHKIYGGALLAGFFAYDLWRKL